MKFKRRKREKGGVEASALSDILFFLLLFFLMVSTLASPEAIKVLLPNATTSKPVPSHPIYLSIDASLGYYVNDQKTDFASLKELLKKEIGNYERASLVIRVDKTVPTQEFINVIDVANQLKLPILVATDKK